MRRRREEDGGRRRKGGIEKGENRWKRLQLRSELINGRTCHSASREMEACGALYLHEYKHFS
jgi:hypothetical protein